MTPKEVPGFLDHLPNAHFVAKYNDQSEEWHALRAKGIGGTEAPIISGLNPYRSKYSLWMEKSGRIEREFKSNGAMEWGRRLESAVAMKFQDEHRSLEVMETGSWSSNTAEWMLCNPDRIVWDPEDEKYFVLELKTANANSASAWKYSPPLHYQAQVQWYMATLDLEYTAALAVLIGGQDYREYTIEPDEKMQARMVKDSQDFLDSIADNKPPEPDGSDSSHDAIRTVNSTIDQGTVVQVGDELLKKYYSASMRYQKVRSEELYYKNLILEMMGSSEYAINSDGDPVFKRVSRAGYRPYLKKLDI